MGEGGEVMSEGGGLEKYEMGKDAAGRTEGDRAALHGAGESARRTVSPGLHRMGVRD